MCADIYELLTGERVWEQPWPQADEALLERDVYELVCQVNGKVRDRVQASADASPEALKELCRAAPNVSAHVDGKRDRQGDRRARQAREPRRPLGALRLAVGIHSLTMPDLKPAYLIHGDDHGAVAERRAGLRALVERQEGGSASIELLEGDAATPAGVADALAAMTLAIGRRVIIVEGVERWREADVEKHLAARSRTMPPETTLALFAREEARAKAPAALHEAVKRAGGQVVAQMTVKPWELRQVGARAGRAPGPRRSTRPPPRRSSRRWASASSGCCASSRSWRSRATPSRRQRVGVEDIERRAAHSTEWRAYALADALVGADAREATLSYLRLREQGERLSGLTYLMAQRLRDALAVALRLQAGESVAEVKRGLRMPARAAERFVADVARSDLERAARRARRARRPRARHARRRAAREQPHARSRGWREDTLALRR